MDNKSFALLNGPNFNLLEAYFNSITYSINKFIGFSFSAKSFWKKKTKKSIYYCRLWISEADSHCIVWNGLRINSSILFVF